MFFNVLVQTLHVRISTMVGDNSQRNHLQAFGESILQREQEAIYRESHEASPHVYLLSCLNSLLKNWPLIMESSSFREISSLKEISRKALQTINGHANVAK